MSRRSLSDLAGLAYPAWWRDRYGPELARLGDDLVADGRSSLRVALSIILGGIAVRFSGAGMASVASLWAERSKWLLAATVLPVLAGTFAVMTALNTAWASLGPRQGSLARVAEDLWTTGMLTNLAVLLVGAAAWQIVLTGVRSTDGRHRRLLVTGLLLPFAVVLGGLVLGGVANTLGMHSGAAIEHTRRIGGVVQHWTSSVPVSDHPLAAAILSAAEGVLGYGGMAVFVVALLASLRRVRPVPWMLGRGILLGRLIALGCALLAVLVGVSGGLIVQAAPFQPFPFSNAPAALPWFWWPCVAGLLALSALCLFGTRAARRCRRVAEELASA